MKASEIKVLMSLCYRIGWRDGMDGKDLPTLKELDDLIGGIYQRAEVPDANVGNIEESEGSECQ